MKKNSIAVICAGVLALAAFLVVGENYSTDPANGADTTSALTSPPAAHGLGDSRLLDPSGEVRSNIEAHKDKEDPITLDISDRDLEFPHYGDTELAGGVRLRDLPGSDLGYLVGSTVARKIQKLEKELIAEILKRDPWLKDTSMSLENAKIHSRQGALLIHDKEKGHEAGYILCPPSDFERLAELQKAFLHVYSSEKFTATIGSEIIAALQKQDPNGSFWAEPMHDGCGVTVYNGAGEVVASNFGSVPGTVH